MLRAAAALHAGVGLQADQLRQVGAGDEAEVFIASERRNLREAAAREKDSDRAEQQMQVLGVRNNGQKMSRARVCTHQRRRVGAPASVTKNEAR